MNLRWLNVLFRAFLALLLAFIAREGLRGEAFTGPAGAGSSLGFAFTTPALLAIGLLLVSLPGYWTLRRRLKK
jgi:hypothetical protein